MQSQLLAVMGIQGLKLCVFLEDSSLRANLKDSDLKDEALITNKNRKLSIQDTDGVHRVSQVLMGSGKLNQALVSYLLSK